MRYLVLALTLAVGCQQTESSEDDLIVVVPKPEVEKALTVLEQAQKTLHNSCTISNKDLGGLEVTEGEWKSVRSSLSLVVDYAQQCSDMYSPQEGEAKCVQDLTIQDCYTGSVHCVAGDLEACSMISSCRVRSCNIIRE